MPLLGGAFYCNHTALSKPLAEEDLTDSTLIYASYHPTLLKPDMAMPCLGPRLINLR